MTIGTFCIWATLHPFLDVFTKDRQTFRVAMLLVIASICPTSVLTGPSHAILIAKYSECHLCFHLHDCIYTINQSGNRLKAHFTDEQDKTPNWLLQANQWPKLVLKLGLLFQSCLSLTMLYTECRNLLITFSHYYSSETGLRALYSLNSCNQPINRRFILSSSFGI